MIEVEGWGVLREAKGEPTPATKERRDYDALASALASHPGKWLEMEGLYSSTGFSSHFRKHLARRLEGVSTRTHRITVDGEFKYRLLIRYDPPEESL